MVRRFNPLTRDVSELLSLELVNTHTHTPTVPVKGNRISVSVGTPSFKKYSLHHKLALRKTSEYVVLQCTGLIYSK